MAKIAPAKIEKAMQIAGVIAASTATNGTMPSDKALRHCCLTGLRIVAAMETVVAAVEEDAGLMDVPLDDALAYVRMNEAVTAIKNKAKREADETEEKRQSAGAAEGEATK